MNTAAHYQVDPAALDRAIDPHTRTVLDLLLYFRIPTRIVGGAVRDLLLGKEPRDIDLVADADPAVLIYLFEGHGIPVDLGGIQHGTVKAVFGHGDNKEKVDVSSLGYRIQRHGHHFEAGGTHSWRVDSALRDLTINSMSMDTKGRVFDYLNGLRDLRNQTVRMAPHSRDSFQLDPNSIMRYFKAVSMFDHPRLHRKDLSWIRENVHLLADVADDQRVQMNLISILKSPNRQQTLDLMCSVGVGRYLPFLPC